MKKRPPSPNKTTIAIQFDNAMLGRLRELAEADNRSIGELVRRAVGVWLSSDDAASVIKSAEALAKMREALRAEGVRLRKEMDEDEEIIAERAAIKAAGEETK
jgi:hypothetical protein